MPGFAKLYYLAVVWLFVWWAGNNKFSKLDRPNRPNLISAMAQCRAAWMRQMLKRDNQIVDIQIVWSLGRSASFFASTSILVLAGLIAILGATERSIEFARSIPISPPVSLEFWEVKMLSLIFVFVYAFFKFGSAMRQLHYCLIMIGAVAGPEDLTDAERKRAENASRVASIASAPTSRGIRSYYFGLALLAWHIHPFALMGSTVFVVGVLYRREFHSRTLKLIMLDNSTDRSEI
ncbi:MAG: DUF599 domain-containing protein [Pseudomonadota bacterium]|nr:DUF599 domain-containing protein [Pseudomonadota bacterium]